MLANKYFIGIDFGTTNIVVSYRHIDGNGDIMIFKIPQMLSPGLVVELSTLPAMRYFEPDFHMNPDLYRLPWGASGVLLGEIAKDKLLAGDTTVVSSVKSWLAHPLLDTGQKILPLGNQSNSAKVSISEVLVEYLSYIKKSWNNKFTETLFEEQSIAITIPASFDERARRELKLALNRSGIYLFKMLEEPQAAFYYWLSKYEHLLKKSNFPTETSMVLVCDIGGGTTDFSIISFQSNKGDVQFSRVSVGEHLLLGGDNIDLCLFYYLKKKYDNPILEENIEGCLSQIKVIKEKMLLDGSIEGLSLNFIKKGTNIVGATQNIRLTREDINNTVIKSFFPECSIHDVPYKYNMGGLRRIGLPYVKDVAITRHLAKFLKESSVFIHKEFPGYFNKEIVIPDTILFNGGVFYSKFLQDKVVDALADWRIENGDTSSIEVLSSGSPSLAVAKGAVYFQSAYSDKHKLFIKSCSPVSYFIEIEGKLGQLLCLLPQGSLPNKKLSLPLDFKLTLGEAVSFPLYYSTVPGDYIAGSFYHSDTGFILLSRLELTLESLENHSSAEVAIEALYTDIGTIEVLATDKEGKSHILEFNPKESVSKIKRVSKQVKKSESKSLNKELYFLLHSYFIDRSIPLYVLNKNLKKSILDVSQARIMFDFVWDFKSRRRKSDEYERTWLNLLGTFILPGVGDTMDAKRIDKLESLYNEGVHYINTVQNHSEWYILWRRCSLGLGADFQQNIFNSIYPSLFKNKIKLSKINRVALSEKMRLVATLDKVLIRDRVQLGDQICSKLKSAPKDMLLWWMIARIGAQNSIFENIDLIPISNIELWVKSILSIPVEKEFLLIQAKSLCFLVKTNDFIERRISKDIYELTLIKIKRFPMLYSFLEEGDDLSKDMESFVIGDDIPLGLSLL